ncbi:unnamed protein product [Linum trigynum]|uniref:Uncharacterized protein n=1 Tax=Linum trigynum TaxID=586398 RepID=A0AAV2ENH9_9ROSI
MELLQPEKREEVKLTLSDVALEQLVGLSEVFTTFNCTVEPRLGLNISSRGKIRTQHIEVARGNTTLKPTGGSCRLNDEEKESRDAEAFIRHSENLKKVEIKVDLLGDQVDALLGLLEKIYHILHQYPPIMQQHFEVSDILMMIKRQLQGSCL